MKVRITGNGFNYRVQRRIFGIWFTERGITGRAMFSWIDGQEEPTEQLIFSSVAEATHYITEHYISDDVESKNTITMEFDIHKKRDVE